MMGETGTSRAPWRHLALGTMWVVVCAGVAVLLALRLAGRVSPWEPALVIPRAEEQAELPNHFFLPPAVRCADLTSDGRLLAVSRPNGQVQVWDLERSRRVATLGTPLATEREWWTGDEGATHVRWLADDQHVAARRDGDWVFYALDGREVPVEADLHDMGDGAPSPIENVFAAERGWPRGDVVVVDVSTGRIRHRFEAPRGGGHSRLDWTADGRYLLLSRYHAIRVWDVRNGRPVWQRPELNVDRPLSSVAAARADSAAREHDRPQESKAFAGPPEPSGRLESLLQEGPAEPNPSNVAYFYDSQFDPSGRYVVSLYTSEMGETPEDPRARRVRFYEATTGRLVWDRQLPARPQQMVFSPDGSRLFVLMDLRFRSRLQVFDVAARELVAETGYDLPPFGEDGVAPLPNGRLFAIYRAQTWLVDTQEERSPLRLGGRGDTRAVLVTPDGERIVQVGIDKAVHLWQRRRAMSAYGAWALPETWGLYGAAMALPVGLVLLAGRIGTKRLGRRLPLVLWADGLLLAAGIGLAVAWAVGSSITAPYYHQGHDVPTLRSFNWVFVYAAMALLTVTGALRVQRWGWFGMILLHGLGLLILAGGGVWLVVEAASDDLPAWHARVANWHGWQVEYSLALVFGLVAVLLVLLGAALLLLLRPGVRELFPPLALPGFWRHPPRRHPVRWPDPRVSSILSAYERAARERARRGDEDAEEDPSA